MIAARHHDRIRHARRRLEDLRRLQSLGLVTRDADFYPSVHYPPITMYGPITENELLDGYTLPDDGLLDVYAHLPFCARCWDFLPLSGEARGATCGKGPLSGRLGKGNGPVPAAVGRPADQGPLDPRRRRHADLPLAGPVAALPGVLCRAARHVGLPAIQLRRRPGDADRRRRPRTPEADAQFRRRPADDRSAVARRKHAPAHEPAPRRPRGPGIDRELAGPGIPSEHRVHFWASRRDRGELDRTSWTRR